MLTEKRPNNEKLTEAEGKEINTLAEQVATQAIRYRNWGAAHELLEKARKDLEAREAEGGYLQTKVGGILDTRIANHLENGAGVLTVRDALYCEVNEVLAIPGYNTHSAIMTFRNFWKHAVEHILLLERELRDLKR